MRVQIRVAGRNQIDSYHPDSVVACAKLLVIFNPMVAPFYNLIAIGIIMTPVFFLSSSVV